MPRQDFLPGVGIRETAEDAIDGLDADAAVAALTEAVDEIAAGHAEELAGESHAVAAEEKRGRDPFETRLIEHWGSALDLYELIAVMARELGSEVNATFQHQAFVEQDHCFAALVSLHARSCRAAFEVLSLLQRGYPVGALSIWRSVYEYAVTARIVSQHSDHAERYLEHEIVVRAADAFHLNKNAAALGVQPMAAAVFEQLQREADQVKKKYGKGFASDYGWASDLMPRGLSGFRGLETLAGLDRMRPHYRLASHGIHSGARGGALNVFEQGGARMLAVGPSNTGLGDPGHGTLLALAQVTSALVNVAPEDVATFQRVVALKALHILVDRARDRFLDAERALDTA
jgi:hypothetical protein